MRPPAPSAGPQRQAAFACASEVLTFLLSEFAQQNTDSYLRTPRLSPPPRGSALNPYRMRALSEHSWTLLLLLETARGTPRRGLFSGGPDEDEQSVWSWKTARDQLRRCSWFGYDFQRFQGVFVRNECGELM